MERHELIDLARSTALVHGLEHSYVVEGFDPHEWVIQAMWDSYCKGFSDGENNMTGMGDG